MFGSVVAMATAPARLSKYKALKTNIRFLCVDNRGTPLIVQLFIIFYGLPSAGIIIGAIPNRHHIGFTLNVGAYNSEVIRAAILSIPKRSMGGCKMLQLA